jgi:stage V sporulation protein G
VEITEVRVYPVREEKLKAFVSVVFDRCFMVNDIKVIQGKEGLFISMPSRRKKNGEFKDVAHPLNQDTRRWVEERILTEYRAALDGKSAPAPQPAPASPAEPTLEEVEQQHLNDSFWGVS